MQFNRLEYFLIQRSLLTFVLLLQILALQGQLSAQADKFKADSGAMTERLSSVEAERNKLKVWMVIY